MSTHDKKLSHSQLPKDFGPEVDPRQKRRSRRPRRSIFLDRIHPQDFQKMNFMFACEQCSHFDGVQIICTMGYRPQHRLADQIKKYELTGKMPLCRFMEID